MWPCVSISRPKFKESLAVSFPINSVPLWRPEAVCAGLLQKALYTANTVAEGISDAYNETFDITSFLLKRMRGTATRVLRLAWNFIVYRKITPFILKGVIFMSVSYTIQAPYNLLNIITEV